MFAANDPTSLQTQLSGISIEDDELRCILQSIEKQEPYEESPPPQSQQQRSTFIEYYDDPIAYQPQQSMF
jgi:hypothetical protein